MREAKAAVQSKHGQPVAERCAAERMSGPDEPRLTDIVTCVLWLLALAVVGFGIYVPYVLTAGPIFPACGTYHGGAASTGSLVTAFILGVLLWLGVGVVAVRRLRSLSLLFVGFIATYVVVLIVLWTVSPLIWGHRYCV